MKQKRLTTENTIFYSTASTGYAIYAATSLLTVRRHLPDAELCVLSSGLSGYEKKILSRHDIDYKEMDLSDKFTQTWEYPIDCYYIFAGPEFFYGQGYNFSVYIDGDVLCARNPLEGLPEIGCVAGVASAGNGGDYSHIFGSDWVEIKKIWSLPQKVASRKRINAGVVYFNNQRMKSLGLLGKAITLFKKSLEHGIPRKGDDSLFSLLQYVYLTEWDVRILPARYNFVLQFNKWVYPVKNLVFFHFSIDKPWKQTPYNHEDKSMSMFNPYVRQWRAQFRKAAPLAWLRNGLQYSTITKMATLVLRVCRRAIRFLRNQMLWLQGLSKSFIARRLNAKKPPLKLYYWNERPNFGDQITTDIITNLLGFRTEWSPPEECEIYGAGSVLGWATGKNSYVWGSGFMFDGDKVNKGLIYCAVRGDLSRSRLGKKHHNIPVGDPGLLANIVYPRSSAKTEKIGVVPHFIDKEDPIIKKIAKDGRFTIIDVAASPAEVARRISSCKLVLSSSLHGLIFSDSYGIPNMHFEISDKVAGDGYKFRDYYSSIGKPYKKADNQRIFDDNYLESIIANYQPVKGLRKIQSSLIRAFPY